MHVRLVVEFVMRFVHSVTTLGVAIFCPVLRIGIIYMMMFLNI